MILLYLLALLISLTGMIVLDRRFRLFFWRDARRAAIVLPVGVVFFLAWDFAGVGGGIFFRGETAFMTGLQIAPEIPLEKVFFLSLLCYLTMNVYGALELALARRRRGPRSRHAREFGSSAGAETAADDSSSRAAHPDGLAAPAPDQPSPTEREGPR